MRHTDNPITSPFGTFGLEERLIPHHDIPFHGLIAWLRREGRDLFLDNPREGSAWVITAKRRLQHQGITEAHKDTAVITYASEEDAEKALNMVRTQLGIGPNDHPEQKA